MPGNITVTGTGCPITVAGLSNGVTYTFTVQAVNSAGSSVASDASNSVTPRRPSGSSNTSTPSTPTTAPDPAPTPATPEPTIDVLNSSIVNEANLVKTIEFKVVEANKANATIDFADTQGHWAEKTINVFGKGDGRFDPKSNATRAEALQIILNVLELNPQLKKLLDSLS